MVSLIDLGVERRSGALCKIEGNEARRLLWVGLFQNGS